MIHYSRSHIGYYSSNDVAASVVYTSLEHVAAPHVQEAALSQDEYIYVQKHSQGEEECERSVSLFE